MCVCACVRAHMSTNACEDADCGCKSALTFMQSWKDPFRYLRLIVYINICVCVGARVYVGYAVHVGYGTYKILL